MLLRMAIRSTFAVTALVALMLEACAGTPAPQAVPAPAAAAPLAAHQFVRVCPAAPLGEPEIAEVATVEVCHAGYASLLDPERKETRVVTYALTAAHSHGNGSRAGLTFKVDTLAPAEDQGRAADYSGSGYDLGHMAPAEDFAWNADQERESFSMANVEPQLPGLNRQGWERLEEIVRAEACARGAVDVFTGPIYSSGAGARTIGADRLAVPDGFFKIAIDPATGWAIAFIAPQRDIAKGEAAAKAAATIAAVETVSGIAFPLPSGVDRTRTTAPDADALSQYQGGACK